MRCLIWMAGVILSAAFFIVGCADTQQLAMPPAQPPGIQTRPVFELLNVKTLSDKVQVVVDGSGLAHVIIASRKLKSVHCVVVGQEGVVRREVIQQSVVPVTIDAAFDKAGVLHVLIDDAHYTQTNGQWRHQPHTPWQQAGVKAHSCRFVRGAEDLIWTFGVSGEDIGSPGRWDWYGFGGYGGGLVWPWYSHGSKRVIVPESSPSYAAWLVVDIDSKKDIDNWRAAANRQGTVYAIYDAAVSIVAYVAEPRWLRFSSRDMQETEISQDRRRLKGISGQLIEGPYDRYGFGSQTSIAADPHSDCALFIKAHSGSWLLGDGPNETFIPLPLKNFWEPRLAAAGNDRFHAVMTGASLTKGAGKGTGVLYLEFSDGRWSSPVQLGLANVSSMWAMIWEAVAVGGNGPEALVVWPTKDGIVGRWVRITQNR